ncbi:unnamed protein product [Mucor hiemalis]
MLKPDTIDDIPSIHTYKPDSKDEPIVIYDKPNTYEEEEQDSQRLPQEVIDDLVVRAEFINDGKSISSSTSSSTTAAALGAKLTSTLLSHVPSSTTGLTSSPPSKLGISPSSSSSCSSFTSSATSRLALFQILKSKPMEDLVSYDLRKYSLTRPHEHIVCLKGTKKQAFHKVQPHSYSWGFQNILYKTTTTSNEKIKIAEARRRAFNKEITIEWGDFPLIISSSEAFEEEEDEEDTIKAETENTTKSNQLHNKNNSHLLFTYETEFEGYKLRWKRGSLLSHDMVCEVKFEQEAEKKRKWHVIAEFDSHRMGYLIHLGELIIDKNALRLVDRPDHFEAHIIITCSTLIDLMRELVEKAVGLGKGGVVGSD